MLEMYTDIRRLESLVFFFFFLNTIFVKTKWEY